MEELAPQLISRPNEPDFSDLFTLSEAEYQELLARWALESQAMGMDSDKSFNDMIDINDVNDLSDIDDADDINDVNAVRADEIGISNFNDLSSVTIRGPYGPPWPFVIEPVEVEIGSAKVKIEIEDENAKYPIGWALLSDKMLEREAEVGFETFCELMGLDAEQIGSLKEELTKIGEIKPFKLEFRPVMRVVRPSIKTAPRTGSTGKSRLRKPARPPAVRKTISVSQQVAEQTAHFAKLFHSSLIDTEVLARPYIEGRKESALKYMGMWGSRMVNVNTAPRHVLEAAFIFGGDEVKIADEIIRQRQVEPFADIEDLKRRLFSYSDSIGKCEKYITTASRFFTIKVTVVSGVAKASSVIAITRDGGKVQRIAVIND